MRMKRVLGAAIAAALLMTGPMAATAAAQDPGAEVETGVGSGLVSSTLLGIDIGNLLNLDLLDDESRSTIDPANGEPISSAVFNPLQVASSILGPLSVGGVATSTTGAEDAKSVSQDVGGGTIPLPIASGLLTGTLSSVVDGEGARSTLSAGAGGLDLVGGLLGMTGTSNTSFETNAAADTARGQRGLSIPSLDVLNLGSLLAGLGLPLENLPLLGNGGDIGGVLGLLDPLGVELEGEDGEMMDGGEVTGMVTGLFESLGLNALGVESGDGLLGLDLGDPCSLLDDLPVDLLDDLPVVDDLLGDLPLLGGGGGGDCVLDAVDLGIVTDLIELITDLLDSLLGDLLGTLDLTSLLSVGDVEAGMVARSSDSVETSEADVVASIGSLNVGNLPLPLPDGGLDLTQGLDVLGGVSNTVSGTLNSVLGIVGLPELLDVDVLEINELVAPDGDYTRALSELNTLGVSLAPLAGILQSTPSGPQDGSIAALGLVDGLVPTGGGMGGVGGLGDLLGGDLLGGVTSLLTEGVNIEVGTMASEGFFTPVAALVPTDIVPPAAQPVTPPADGTLPRTGTSTALPAAMAVLLLGAAFAVRRLVRPEPVRGEEVEI